MWLLLLACVEDPCKDGYCGDLPDPVVNETLLPCADIGFESPPEPLRAFCVGCSGTTCSWQTLASVGVARVELDVAGAAPDVADWSEYHDAFTVDDDELWSLTLDLASSTGEYTSGQTTLLDPESADVTWLFSAADEEGVYLDCAWSGADAERFSDCREL